MISMNTLNTLCEEAGIDPTRVSEVKITPFSARFTVYSVNIYGEKMLNRDRDAVITHYVIAQVD
jgi:hypothetical protein